MSGDRPSLGRVQRWVQAVVTHPGGARAGVDSAAAREQIDVDSDALGDVVARRGALSEEEALEIYNRGYRLRLLECFRAEYPVLLHALGDDLFERFALDYLERHPSTSYSLFYLCENFPAHLAATRPDAEARQGERESWPDFIIDLARLERSFNEVFAGAGAEGDTLVEPAAVKALDDADLTRSRFETVAGARLLAFSYPVVAYFDEVRSAGEPELPEPARTFALLNRRDFTVVIHPVERLEFVALGLLMHGETVGDALAVVAGEGATAGEALGVPPRVWVGRWAERGLWRAISA